MPCTVVFILVVLLISTLCVDLMLYEGFSFAEVLSYQIIPAAPNTRRDALTSKRVYRDRGISHIPIPLDIHRIFIKLQPFRFRLIPNQSLVIVWANKSSLSESCL